MTTPATAEELRDAQAKEFGTYVAAERIRIRGALAFLPGDPVPVSHVEGDNAVLSTSQVHKITTKAGREAAGIDEKG